MSDGGKGSGRRKEDLEKVRSNWDLIDWGRKAEEVTKTGQENLKKMTELLGVKSDTDSCANCGKCDCK